MATKKQLERHKNNKYIFIVFYNLTSNKIKCNYSKLLQSAANLKGIKGFWLFLIAVSQTDLRVCEEIT